MVEIAPRIVLDKNVRFGKPVIKGTREDVLAALSYAAHAVADEQIRAVS